MQPIDPQSLLTFKLFMGGYWNQIADEVFGTLGAALEQFVSDASRNDNPAEYLGNLVMEMREVRRRGYALELDGVETPEVWEFWSNAGGRGLSGDDFDLIDKFLTQRIA